MTGGLILAVVSGFLGGVTVAMVDRWWSRRRHPVTVTRVVSIAATTPGEVIPDDQGQPWTVLERRFTYPADRAAVMSVELVMGKRVQE